MGLIGYQADRFGTVWLEAFHAIEEREFDEKAEGAHGAALLFDQFSSSYGRATGGQKIVVDHDVHTGSDAIHMHFHFGTAVLEIVLVAHGLPRQFAFFSDREEWNSQSQGQRHSEKESTAFDPRYGIYTDPAQRFLESFHGCLAQLWIFEQRGYITKEDPRFREIRDRTNAVLEALL